MSDERVAERARVGDQRAFEVIFERYHQELYRYCMAILSNPDDARDALQSTMAAALRSLPGDERRIELRPWLYRVAHNEAISIVRRRSPLIEPDEIEETLALGTEGEAETRERLRQLVADLRSLPERQRSALVMRELSGLSYGEISEAMGASEGTARQAVYEARSALREIAGGREMDCDEVRRAVSDHDGRVLRGRRIRAHLRSCAGCRDFRTAIGQRRSDLHALCPPFAPAAAAGALSALLGGAGSGAGTAGGTIAAAASGAGAAGTGGAVLGSGVATGGLGAGASAGAAGGAVLATGGAKLAAVVVAVALGAGAASVTGVVKLPLVSGSGSDHASPALTVESGDAGDVTSPAAPAAQASPTAQSRSHGQRAAAVSHGQQGLRHGQGHRHARGQGNGRAVGHTRTHHDHSWGRRGSGFVADGREQERLWEQARQ